jgi:hypothetical protein
MELAMAPQPALRWPGNVDDGDIFHVGADGIPSLFERDAAKNDRVPGNGAGIVVREMIVAHRHGVGLDAGRDVEVGSATTLVSLPE